MSDLWIQIVNMSIVAGWLILAVIALRLFIKPISKSLACFLWIFVGVRLLCPVSIESAVSLIPSSDTISIEENTAQPYLQSGFEQIDNNVNAYFKMQQEHISDYANISDNAVGTSAASVNVLALVWLIGMSCMLLYLAVNYILLRRKLAASVLVKKNIYMCDAIETPFILAGFPAHIYLPSSLRADAYESVLAHEQAHLRRKDHISKLIGFIVLSIYWFHPCVWIAYILFCKDIEMACDERVMRKFDVYEKKRYLQSLLYCSDNRQGVSAIHLAFGEIGVKERVKAAIKYKKQSVWIVAIAGIICLGVLVCFMTNPMKKDGHISNSAESITTENTAKNETQGNDKNSVVENDKNRITENDENSVVENDVHIVNTYEATSNDENDYDALILLTYYEMSDGSWKTDTHSYKYRLIFDEKKPGMVVLSNRTDITYQQAFMASGLSSNMNDYFNPKDAVIVEMR